MPSLPSFISFTQAVQMSAAHMGWDADTAIAAVIVGCCDGAIETWGAHAGSMPEIIPPRRWTEMKYTGRPLPCEVDRIEVLTLAFFKWLMPEQFLTDAPGQLGGTSEAPSETADATIVEDLTSRQLEHNPNAQGRKPTHRPAKRLRVVEALSALYPDGEPDLIDVKDMLSRVAAATGNPTSRKTLERAREALWRPNKAKPKPN